jgi:hypothetical protein
MSDWLFHLPVLWMGLLILAAVYAVTGGLYLIITRLTVGERGRAFKAISPGMLLPLAIMFALLTGFIAAQDWGDLERASAAVNQEVSALRGVVLLSAAFPGEFPAHFTDLVRSYIQSEVSQEWPAMSRQTASLTLAPPQLAEALRRVLSLKPEGEGQVIAQRKMVAALHRALEARRLRIILSGHSINGVQWTVLLVQAALTQITIGMIHSDNPRTNRIIMTIFATGIGVAIILIASHSRPFTGDIAVRPTPLLQVMPEAPAATSP